MAETAIAYLNRLEAPKIKGNKKASASGHYRSRYPNHEKQAIEWNQPSERLAPVYHFELDCPYCGRHVELERFSPKEPKHCEQETCREAHARELARLRKQRQRARQKQK